MIAALTTATMAEDRRNLEDVEPAAEPAPAAIDPESSFALVLRVREGDRIAAELLFARYSRRLHQWAHGSLPPWARGLGDTHDLVQDTMMQVFRRLPGFQPRHAGAFFGYVRRTLHNNIVNRVRGSKGAGAFEVLDDENEARLIRPETPEREHQIDVQRRFARYEVELEQLKPEYREVIIARNEMGLAWDEIAELMQKSAGAVQMQYHRAVLKLAEQMAQPPSR